MVLTLISHHSPHKPPEVEESTVGLEPSPWTRHNIRSLYRGTVVADGCWRLQRKSIGSNNGNYRPLRHTHARAHTQRRNAFFLPILSATTSTATMFLGCFPAENNTVALLPSDNSRTAPPPPPPPLPSPSSRLDLITSEIIAKRIRLVQAQKGVRRRDLSKGGETGEMQRFQRVYRQNANCVSLKCHCETPNILDNCM